MNNKVINFKGIKRFAQQDTTDEENWVDVMVSFASLMLILVVFYMFFQSYQKLYDEGKIKSAVYTQDSTRYVFTLNNTEYFKRNSTDFTQKAESELTELGKLLNSKIGNHKRKWQVRIEGHSDDIPFSNSIYSSNLDLSSARATSIANFFIARGFFHPDQLQTVGYGDLKPVVPNISDENRISNRRVNIVLYKNK